MGPEFGCREGKRSQLDAAGRLSGRPHNGRAGPKSTCSHRPRGHTSDVLMSPSPSSPTPRDEGSKRRGREATWSIHPNQPSEALYPALLASSRYGGCGWTRHSTEWTSDQEKQIGMGEGKGLTLLGCSHLRASTRVGGSAGVDVPWGSTSTQGGRAGHFSGGLDCLLTNMPRDHRRGRCGHDAMEPWGESLVCSSPGVQ